MYIIYVIYLHFSIHYLLQEEKVPSTWSQQSREKQLRSPWGTAPKPGIRGLYLHSGGKR